EYEKKEEYEKAFRLFIRITEYEQEKPYFRHFMDEVIDRLYTIVCVKMTGKISKERHIACLKEILTLNFSEKKCALFLKKIAEIYSELGKNDIACYYLNIGIRMKPDLSGIKKLKEKICYKGSYS
ncbi:MAG: hypothetical protein AB1798_21890, partial [Spirochaetota bacterium]